MRSFSNYQKVSELTTADIDSNEFDHDGLPFKGKLIGMEDLSIDRDELACLDSLFKLKTVVRARGEHKQKIQLNLALNGIKVYDESTKVQLACHEIQRISFVIIDPSDSRAFGYIYNTTDDRHQFWAIKTERPAYVAVFAIKDLFEEAFKLLKNSDTAQVQADQTTSKPVSVDEVTVSIQKSPTEFTPVFLPPPPKSAPQITQAPTTPLFDDTWGGNLPRTVPRPLETSQQQSTFNNDPWGDNVSKTVPQPLQTSQQQSTFNNDPWGGNLSTTVAQSLQTSQQQSTFNNDPWGDNVSTTVNQPLQTSQQQSTFINDPWGGNLSTTVAQSLQISQQQSTFNNDPWGDNLSTIVPQPLQTSQQQPIFNSDPWSFSKPVVPVKQPAPRREDSPVNIFSLPPPPPSRRTTTNQKPASTADVNDLLSIFTAVPPMSHVNNNVLIQPTQQPSFVFQQQQQQPDVLGLMPASSITSPPVTNSSGGFDLLGDFSFESTA